MRIHVAPVHTGRPQPQCDWLRAGIARSGADGWEVVEEPACADVILLTDVGWATSHARFKWDSLRLLSNPLVRRYRSRCYLYHEQDVPRPYLPGLYSYMEWFCGVERVAASIPPAHALEAGANEHVTDAPPPTGRDLLCSFVGRNCHPVRDALLRLGEHRRDVVLIDTSDTYDHSTADAAPARQRAFVEIARRSRWAICPRGWSVSSRRPFEMMCLGIAPVVVADNWLRPVGPEWDRCCLWIREADLPDLLAILESSTDDWYAMGLAAQEAYRAYFAPPVVFERSLTQLTELRTRRRDASVTLSALRQWREFLWHFIGLTAPEITATRKRGLTAIEHQRQPTGIETPIPTSPAAAPGNRRIAARGPPPG